VGPFESQQRPSGGIARTYHIAWWNLENLFDEEDAVALGRRTEKVFRAIKNDIAGWTPELRDRKIDQLATVIAAMNARQGPNLLGVCEVENRFVVDRLVERVNAMLPLLRAMWWCTPKPMMLAASMSRSFTTTRCSGFPYPSRSQRSFTW
jgi:hypothetical protein